MKFVLALDQGTTSSRSILFDESGAAVTAAQREFPQHYPRPGWVEHDAEEIWASQQITMDEVVAQAETGTIAAIGITNQRETTVVWDAVSGEAVCNAIVWQDRRTAERCEELRAEGLEELIRSKTGLRLDPYFSASKVQWILDNVDGARGKAAAGQLRFGTVDSWLVWKLTEGRVHVTDVSNASRTNLFNIREQCWDDELLDLFDVPRTMLPEVVDSSGVLAEWRGIPIAGMAGDQHAALFGQACFEVGMAKNTYGTGSFLLMNTGERAIPSECGLLTTIGWRTSGKTTYALEGSLFVAGALFQWLRDELQIVSSVQEVDELGASVPDSGGCVLVPAFAGLGAPHWDPFARGAMFGVTRGTSRAHICRAALEAVALQSLELAECMEKDSGIALTELRVDGGAARSDVLMQIQADFLSREVVRPNNIETTAFGAAALAGLATGVWNDQADFVERWMEERRFSPAMSDMTSVRARWDRAIQCTREWGRD